MGLFDDVFGGGAGRAAHAQKKAQQRAMEEYQGAWGDEQGFLNPTLGGQYGGQHLFDALMNPQEFYNQTMSGYEMSPAAQKQLGMAEESIRNAAGASGMAGSTDLAQNAAGYARDFTREDMQNYFQNQMGILGQGMGVGNNLASYRDLLGQRMGQGRLGIGQAEAQGALAHGQALQNAIAKGIGAFSGGMYGVPGGASGGLQGAFQGMGYAPIGHSDALQLLSKIYGIGA